MWQGPLERTLNLQIQVQKEGKGSKIPAQGQKTSTNPGHMNSRYRQETLGFTDHLNWLQVRDTVWVRIQEDGRWCQGTIVSSRPTTDKVREGAMVSIFTQRARSRLGDLISVVVGKILAGERLPRRQDGTNETITPERRHQSRHRTSTGPPENQRFPRMMLLSEPLIRHRCTSWQRRLQRAFYGQYLVCDRQLYTYSE